MKKTSVDYYDEIPLPLMKIRKVGNSFVYTIPSRLIVKYDMREGDTVFCVLFRRKKTLSYEVKDNEEVIILTKKEREEYEKFKKNKQKSLHL